MFGPISIKKWGLYGRVKYWTIFERYLRAEIWTSKILLLMCVSLNNQFTCKVRIFFNKQYNWEMFTANSLQFRQHGAAVDFYINAEYFHNFGVERSQKSQFSTRRWLWTYKSNWLLNHIPSKVIFQNLISQPSDICHKWVSTWHDRMDLIYQMI